MAPDLRKVTMDRSYFCVLGGGGVLQVAKFAAVNLSASLMMLLSLPSSPCSPLSSIFRKCVKHVQRNTACTSVPSFSIPLPASRSRFRGVLVFCRLVSASS